MVYIQVTAVLHVKATQLKRSRTQSIANPSVWYVPPIHLIWNLMSFCAQDKMPFDFEQMYLYNPVFSIEKKKK